MFKKLLTSLSAISLLGCFSAVAEETQEEAVVFEQEVEKNEVEATEETSFTETLDQQLNLSFETAQDKEEENYDDDDDTETDEYIDLKRLA